MDYNTKAHRRAEARRRKMQAYRDKGWTLEKIGRRFGGISKARVRVILSSGSAVAAQA